MASLLQASCPRWARRSAATLALLVASCESPVPVVPPPDPPPQPPPGRALFLVDDPADTNGSEKAIAARVAALGLEIVWIDDDAFTTGLADGCALVLMSKSIDDEVLGNKLKPVRCGIVFWDENQQQLRMLATIDNDGSLGNVWHTQGDTVWVRPDAPAALRAGLSGLRALYARRDELSFGPVLDVPPQATVVAERHRAGDHKVIYAYDRGTTLADGTPAAGRRVFFGLYRDTFVRLSPDGLALWDAAVAWARQ
jgi:hypothetical protein